MFKVGQWYGEKGKGLGLGLYGWTTLKILGVKRIDRIPTAFIRELCLVTKGKGERINQSGSSILQE